MVHPLGRSPAGAVLNHLQKSGSATIKELESALGVTATAVRQQIANLLAEGYIEQHIERRGRGRPRHVYSLTSKGHSLFSRHYNEFINSLLREIMLTDGAGRVQELLSRLSKHIAEQYTRQISSRAPAERAMALTDLMNAKGILAEVCFEPDGIVVREYTCPYYELAREYRAICDMEEEMISHVIRQPAVLVACVLDGYHGCQFRIEEPGGEAEGNQ